MACAWVCNACRHLSPSRHRPVLPRQYQWRLSSTYREPPFILAHNLDAVDGVDKNPTASNPAQRSRKAPQPWRSQPGEDDHLENMFQSQSLRSGRGMEQQDAQHKPRDHLKAPHPSERSRTTAPKRNGSSRSGEARTGSQTNRKTSNKSSQTPNAKRGLQKDSSDARGLPLHPEEMKQPNLNPGLNQKHIEGEKTSDVHSLDPTVRDPAESRSLYHTKYYGVSPQGIPEGFLARIRKAVEKQDGSRMEDLWSEARGQIDRLITTNDKLDTVSSVYAHFLWGFTSLQRPNRAIQVWNEMIQANVKPTTAMWDVMLNGFATVRSHKGIQEIWDMMIESGFKPDTRLWATRVRGLAASDAWRMSMQAFEEMMLSWLQAVKAHVGRNPKLKQRGLESFGDVDGCPKPSVEVLNGLITGLVRLFKKQQLMQALSWGQALGIKMDAFTFNPILRMALNDGDNHLANKILDKMNDLGVKRDVATYTLMLQSHFLYTRTDTKENISRDEKSEDAADNTLGAASRILDDIEGSGLEANAYTFSTIISALLKQANNLEAATAVRDYMVKKNIPLSSQIYTSFITAHFTRGDAPDIAEVVSVWQQARADRSVVLDDIFYDRLIEGFGRSGDIGRLKTALAQVGRSGNVPGWVALTEAISLLAKAQDWDAVEAIVRDVKAEEQGVDRTRRGKGKRLFWDTVTALGFDEDGAVERGGNEREGDYATSSVSEGAIPSGQPGVVRREVNAAQWRQ